MHKFLTHPVHRTHPDLARMALLHLELSLASGEVIAQHQWTVCPIQEEVIKRLEVLAIKDKQPLIQSTGLVVEWGQVIQVLDEMVDRSDNIVNQSNHNLVVLTSKNNFDENSVHENPAENVFDDDQESELEQSLQVDYDNTLYENQGAEYEGEIVPEHEHDESNDTQECVEDEQDNEQITSANTEEHEPRINGDQTLETQTENETNTEIVDMGVELIEGEQGATYNLRNRLTLRAPRRFLEVMDNPHSTKAYETPTILLQLALDHVTGSYGG